MLYVFLALAACGVAFLLGVGYLRTLREAPYEKAPILPDDLPRLGDQTRRRPVLVGVTSPVPNDLEVTPAADEAAGDRPRLPLPVQALRRDLRWLQLLANFLLIFNALVFGVGLVALFSYLHQLRLDALPPSVAVVAPFSLLGGLLPGFLLVFVVTPLPTVALLRLVLGRRRYQALFDFDYGHTGIRNPRFWKRVLLAVAAVLCVVAAGSVLITMNWYTRFEQSQMVVKPALSFGARTYSYDRVYEMRITDTQREVDNQTERHAKFEIAFDDGFVWRCDDFDSYWMDRPVNVADRERLLQLLKDKTGKPIVTTIEPPKKRR